MKKINSNPLVKTYIVFLDLPIDVSSRIDLVINKYNPKNFKKWRAHLTLKYEEELLISSEEKLFRILNEFVQHQEPIKLNISDLKINKQKNIGWNIYLTINNPEIKEIVQKLSRKIGACIRGEHASNQWEQSSKYYPHISVMGGNSLKDSTNYYNLLKLESFNFPSPVLCKTITLACWDNDCWKKVRTFKLKGVIKTDPISMSWGYPDLDDFPKNDFAKICQCLAIQNPQNYLQYDPSIGLEKLRKLIMEEKISGCSVRVPEDILITPGGTFSIFLTCFIFKNILGLRSIGVFLPCYDTALEIFKILNLEVIDLNESQIDNKKISTIDCLYLNPRFNNPTGLTINASSTKTIKKILSKDNIYAIEDDVYHIYNYSNNKKFKNFKNQYPDQVFYIDSFSKILAPGFRLGYMIPPSGFMEKAAYLQKYLCSSSSTLSQELAYELMKYGKYEQIVRKLLKTYSKKMAVLESSLNKYGLNRYSKRVDGGLYKWMETPRPLSNDLRQKLLEKNVNVVDGTKYFIYSPEKYFIRLSIANIRLKEIDSSIKVLKEIIYENTSG